jgi:hypothetical protein
MTKTIYSLIAFSFIIIISAGFITLKKNEVKHIVVFKYKEAATPAQIDEVTTAFKALKGKIPGIISVETGVNNSPEKLNKGFTHVYLLTFKDVASRDAYLPHPEHKKFGELLSRLGVLEDVLVVDFESVE